VRGSYYDVLGLSQSSSDEDIRERYLHLIRRYHPDLNRSPLAQIRSAQINEAYRHLSDATLRAGHNAQLTAKRQKVVTARALGHSRHQPGTALVRRPRSSLIKRYAAGFALGALLLGTGVAGWQMQMRLPRGAGGIPSLPIADGNDDSRRTVAELVAASAQAAQSMPNVSSDVVKQGVRAFVQLDKKRPGQAQLFSELCHARASTDEGWNTLDFCVSFDEAAFARASRRPDPALDTAYFFDRHDGAAHSYIYKVASMDAIERRLARIQGLVNGVPQPKRDPVARVLHGISKRSRKLAGAAWQAIGLPPKDDLPRRKAHDF
jgi:hypothetical protein